MSTDTAPIREDRRVRRTAGTVETRSPARRGRGPIYADRTFRRYLASYSLSVLGDHMWFLALGWSASSLHNSLHTSAVLAVATLPRALLLLFGGTVVDRYGALAVALTSQKMRIAVMAATAVGALAWPGSTVVLVTAALLFGIFDAAHMPAIAALPLHMLDRRDLPLGQGVVQSVQRVMGIAGAPLGSVLVALGGLSLAVAGNAVLFLMAWSILAGLRQRIAKVGVERPPSTRAPLRSELTAGLRYAFAERVIGPVLIVVAVVNIAMSGPLNVGLALLANTRGWGASGLGLIMAGFAAGAGFGAVVCTGRPRRPAAAGLRWVFVGSGCFALLPSSPNLAAAVACASAAGLTVGPASALLIGLVQSRVGAAHLGRISSLINFSSVGLIPLSLALFGALASAMTLRSAFLVLAAAQAVVAVIAYALPVVRTATLEASAPLLAGAKECLHRGRSSRLQRRQVRARSH